MTPARRRDLAERVTEELFVDGLGQRAEHLVLHPGGSGWGREAVQRRIDSAIKEALDEHAAPLVEALKNAPCESTCFLEGEHVGWCAKRHALLAAYQQKEARRGQGA